jgi:GNAT superfamily N-acetyltransferase
MLEIVILTEAECRPYFSQIANIYQKAFAAPPYNETLGDVLTFEGRLPYHARWKGFRCATARLNVGEAPVGFAYGYATQPDTWWHEQVSEHMPAEMAAEWLVNSFEFVELAVLPEHQGRGIGGRLHDALLAGLPQRRAILSTPQQQTNALHLYQKRGWINLIENFLFPGVTLEYRIMGKKMTG